MDHLPLLAAMTGAAEEPSTTDQIREAATFASIALGILSAFAGQRAALLSAQAENLGTVKKPKTLRKDFLIDSALAAFGLLLLLAASPLFVAAADRITPLLETDTTFFSLFCLFYVGVVLVVIWVLAIARKRGKMLKRKSRKTHLLPALLSPE
jgi:hypothetical protein